MENRVPALMYQQKAAVVPTAKSTNHAKSVRGKILLDQITWKLQQRQPPSARLQFLIARSRRLPRSTCRRFARIMITRSADSFRPNALKRGAICDAKAYVDLTNVNEPLYGKAFFRKADATKQIDFCKLKNNRPLCATVFCNRLLGST